MLMDGIRAAERSLSGRSKEATLLEHSPVNQNKGEREKKDGRMGGADRSTYAECFPHLRNSKSGKIDGPSLSPSLCCHRFCGVAFPSVGKLILYLLSSHVSSPSSSFSIFDGDMIVAIKDVERKRCYSSPSFSGWSFHLACPDGYEMMKQCRQPYGVRLPMWSLRMRSLLYCFALCVCALR